MEPLKSTSLLIHACIAIALLVMKLMAVGGPLNFFLLVSFGFLTGKLLVMASKSKQTKYLFVNSWLAIAFPFILFVLLDWKIAAYWIFLVCVAILIVISLILQRSKRID